MSALPSTLPHRKFTVEEYHYFIEQGVFKPEERIELWEAEVPELAGCMADGATYQEALANAEIIIQEWIETARDLGRQIPEPKGRLVFA